MKHRHHITPKHRGGADTEDNLTPPISVTCHAMFHYCEWRRTEDEYDYLAWKALAGQISTQEATLRALQISSRKTCQKRNVTKNPMWDTETKRKVAKKCKEFYDKHPEKRKEIAERQRLANTGLKRTDKQKQNSSNAAKQRWQNVDAKIEQSKTIKNSWKDLSPEQRAERIRKGHETRKRNKGL